MGKRHFKLKSSWSKAELALKLSIILIFLMLMLYYFTYNLTLSFFMAFFIIITAHSSIYRWLVLEPNYIRILKKMMLAIKELPVAVCFIDGQGNMIWRNKKIKSYFNLKDSKNSLTIFPLISQEVLKQALVDPKQRQGLLELTPELHLEYVVHPLSTRHFLLIYFTDISERILYENARKRLFANISHELRVPLTVLQGYIEILENQKKEVKYDKADLKPYKSMQKQVNRLLSMVEQLLTLARIEDNLYSETLEVVDMPDIIYSIYDELQIRKGKKHIIRLYLDDELVVEGYPKLLSECVSNLIYNAIEHNPKLSEIEIRWQKVEQDAKTFALFAIQDNGVGIGKEHLNHLTERFYMVSSARQRTSHGGSGLGLAIVSHALKKHGSHLFIESEPGRGSLFRFYLPAYEQ